MPDHGSHHEAREDFDQFLAARRGEREEDEGGERPAGGEEEQSDVVHMEAGGKPGPDTREETEEGEYADGEEERCGVQAPPHREPGREYLTATRSVDVLGGRSDI